MKVAAYYGTGDVRVEERPVPVPGPNQMVVKISYVGICGTDVEFFHGHCPPFVQLPMVLGHENSGVVAAVGEGVTDFKVGDKVLCGPPSHCPEDCPLCQHGQTNICINGFPRTAGIGGPDGGYAEYYLVRDVAHTMIIKVPDNVDLKDAVLFDVICVSLHGIRMVAIAPGYTDIGWPADSHLREARDRLPLKRFAQPEEIAKGVAFLASPDATYMTGCTLTMDGGATLPVVAANDFI